MLYKEHYNLRLWNTTKSNVQLTSPKACITCKATSTKACVYKMFTVILKVHKLIAVCAPCTHCQSHTVMQGNWRFTTTKLYWVHEKNWIFTTTKLFWIMWTKHEAENKWIQKTSNKIQTSFTVVLPLPNTHTYLSIKLKFATNSKPCVSKESGGGVQKGV